jgi:hypothetical protein
VSQWTYTQTPKPGKDARKIVTLKQDGMVWVGIRAWHNAGRYWMNGHEPERAHVLAWMDLPEPAPGRWVRGRLVGEDGKEQP